MEDVKRTEPAIECQETWTEAGEVTSWEAVEDHTAVSTVLQAKRWEQQEGPFRGFGSPPGKF